MEGAATGGGNYTEISEEAVVSDEQAIVEHKNEEEGSRVRRLGQQLPRLQMTRSVEGPIERPATMSLGNVTEVNAIV